MKNKLIAFTFILILGIGLTLTFTLPDKKMSTLERRKLTTKEVLESGFVENLDDYMSEQIPFRNTFLAFGSAFERYILQNEESNDSYIKDGYIIEKNYHLDEVSIDNFIKKLNFIADKVTPNGDVFYSVIPDKSYYLNADSSLKLDYDDIETKLRSSIEGEYIDILECFELSDYYKTDIHLKQEAYFKILDKFLDRVGIKEEDIKILIEKVLELKEKMVLLFQDKNLVKQFSEKSKEFALNKYSKEIYYEKLYRIYQNLQKGK